MSSEPLQDRRRHRTEREIAAAALDLFEQHGVDGTTVDDIARVAGVSARTVFRYATTKERAALIADHEVEARVDRGLDALRADHPLVPQLEALWRAVLTALGDGRSESGSHALRLWRLAAREPRLLLAAIAQDEERLARFQARLADRLDLDPLAVRVVLESTSAVVRVALDRWASDPAAHELVATYDAACRALGDHSGLPLDR
ncbi:DNA-binding transcriptional regulator, AcrR family [Nocardioides scoriae]|uniref:DNA-binding transcriptional regulator, AcrR family n=1 Tax=Nocardioides scoriae TaxID=642780 RepID=A0A1H1U8E7_9ACTN|nr:TetR/AcrR family transcriptional regulator [Nocardioides scoriae]SDS68734.1 DNA-binding transcriptional regulator, AcrR family [Nocardioides scoriae]